MSRVHSMRLLMIGDSAVGKSALLTRYMNNEFDPAFMSTIGMDFRLKTVPQPNGDACKVHIYDTAGQERFRSITHNYYRAADGIVLVYDVTDQSSFQHVRHWVNDIFTHSPQGVQLVLVGNKCDRAQDKVIATEQGRELAREYTIPFVETSACTGANVEEAFTGLVNQVLRRNAGHEPAEHTVLLNPTAVPVKRTCC